MHLGCVAHLCVNSRTMSCPVCRSGWSVSAQDTFMRQCREQQVSLPQVAQSYSTRSVPSPASLPVPPDSVISRVVLPASRVGGRWVELPSRHMAWATIVSTLNSPPLKKARSRRDPARPVALLEARGRKEATYPELLASARYRLAVIGVEVERRWGSEAASFLRLLARARARAAPDPALRSADVHRRSGLLCAAASLAFADSLTSLPSPGLSNLDGPCPDSSRLPAR